MPRATLTFTLPDEQSEFQNAVNGQAFKVVLFSFDQYLRNRVKYEPLPDAVYAALQSARSELHAMLSEHGVSLDD